MADTNGIAALLKALNETPALGLGLKAETVARSAAVAKSAATTATSATSANRMVGLTGQSISPKAVAAPTTLPKILAAEGESYNSKAPRGTYLNIVI